MSATEALLALISFGPVAFIGGCYFGARYPHLILGRNRHHGHIPH